MNPLADRVRAERLRRDWSVREAARAGGLSNTWWARFEDGVQPLTDGIAAGVQQAFGWDADWATRPGDDPTTALRAQVADLAEQVAALSAGLAAMGAEVARLRDRRRRGGDE